MDFAANFGRCGSAGAKTGNAVASFGGFVADIRCLHCSLSTVRCSLMKTGGSWACASPFGNGIAFTRAQPPS